MCTFTPQTMKANNQPSVLITGANGYVGSNLALVLRSKGIDLTLSDLSDSSLLSDIPYRSCNFLNPDEIQSLLNDKEYDYLYFFTGKTGTSHEARLNKDAFVAGNEWTLRNLLNVLSGMSKRPRVIFPSTRLIYKGGNEKLLDELSELEPKSVYAENKLVCETTLKQFGDQYGIDYAIFRISLPYCSNLPMEKVSYGVMAYLLGKARRGEELQLFGDGSQRVSLVHIDDLTELLWHGGIHPAASSETFNIGGPDSIPMSEVLETISAHFKVHLNRIEWPEDMISSNQGHLALSSEKIVHLLSYSFGHRFHQWILSQEVHR